MIRRIASRKRLCELTGLWYIETRYYLNEEEVSKEDFDAAFPARRVD